MWISCRIRSDSHTLSEAPFRIFQLAESNIRVHKVQERSFVISVRALNESDPEPVQVHHGHNVIKAILISLNVAAIGSFYWHEDPWVHPVMTVTDDFEGSNARSGALVVASNTTYDELKPITELDVENTAKIFGIVAREKDSSLVEEYCRGLLLLRMNFYDINFRRDAFLCFYRALEQFVAARLLNVNRLRNELRDLKRGLAKVGASQDLLDELREVYAIRSSQVAHAQNRPRDITFDEVMKTKVFLDYVMHKTFKDQANQFMEARRNA